MGRMTRVHTKGKIDYHVEETMDLWAADLMGPIKYKSHDSKKYVLVVMDVHSHHVFVVLLNKKSEATAALKCLIVQEQTQKGRTLKRLHTDGGGEFVNEEMKKFLEQQGTIQTWTTTNTPQHNAMVERMNRTLGEKTRTIMYHAHARSYLWGEAIKTAAHIVNHTPCEWTGHATPYELYTGRNSTQRNMHVWGCDVYVHVKKRDYKFSATGGRCVFVGYDENNGTYFNVYDRTRKKVTRVHDVEFDEENFTEMKGADDDKGEEESDDESIREKEGKEDYLDLDKLVARNRGQVDNAQPSSSSSDLLQQHHINSRPDTTHTITRSGRVSAPPQRYTPSAALTSAEEYAEICALMGGPSEASVDGEPVTYKEAVERNDAERWKQAMQEEVNALEENNTWTAVERAGNMNVIGTKWVYKYKRNAEGVIERHKARLVAKGYAQVEGVDYRETFAPVLRYKTLRILLILSAHRDVNIEQLDVKTAFLNAEVKEDIYVEVPEGMETSFPANTVLKLRRALYGIKQAPHEWNENINSYLVELGFKRCVMDTCLYVKVTRNNNIMIIGLFVDDIVVSYRKKDLEEWLKTKILLKRKYKMSDIGQLHHILGMRVTRKQDGSITVDQETYITSKLKEFNMHECRPVTSPEVITKRDGSPDLDDAQSNLYRKIVGSVLYASTSTRPDISHAVHTLTRFMKQPKECDMVSAKRLLRYLKGAASLRLLYKAAGDTMQATIIAFCDSDLGGDNETGKSTTGYCVYMNDCLVTWCAKRQDTVALSTTEAEWMAASDCTKELIWLQQLLSEISIQTALPMKLNEDNTSTIKICNNDVMHERSKHVRLRYHRIRDEIKDGVIEMVWVPTGENTADIFTKATTPAIHNKLRQHLLSQQ